jgi:hypothetical protein
MHLLLQSWKEAGHLSRSKLTTVNVPSTAGMVSNDLVPPFVCSSPVCPPSLPGSGSGSSSAAALAAAAAVTAAAAMPAAAAADCMTEPFPYVPLVRACVRACVRAGDQENGNHIARLRYNTMYLDKMMSRIAASAPEGSDISSWRY